MTLGERLESHTAADALEAQHLSLIRRFVAAHPDPFDRLLPDGHCTASAFITSADADGLLLVFHRKLACWLQPGGHGEAGETEGELVALREAEEETGVTGLQRHPLAPRPLDVDVHRIPAFEGVPAHDHLDLRYLFVAPRGAQPEACATETAGARWFSWLELNELPLDLPMRRAIRKIRAIVMAGRP